MQASVSAMSRARLVLEIHMLKALLVSHQDILSLRATFTLPQHTHILDDHPSLRAALEHPQPDFGAEVREVAAAVSAVCDNTIYPEDWDELSQACEETRTARQAYFKALEAIPPTTSTAVPKESLFPVGYALVYERPGSSDSPLYDKKLFTNFEEACAALREWAQRDFCEDEDGFQFVEGGGHGGFWINLTAACGSVASTYRLQAFTL